MEFTWNFLKQDKRPQIKPPPTKQQESSIEKKGEHSQRVEKPNHNSNLALLGVDPWID